MHQIKEFSKQTQNTKAFDTSIRSPAKKVTIQDRVRSEIGPYHNIRTAQFDMQARSLIPT